MWKTFFSCTIPWGLLSICYTLAMEMTTVAQAALLSNLNPIILAMYYKFVVKRPISVLEISGTVLAVMGMGICVVFPILLSSEQNEIEKEGYTLTRMLMGDLLAVMASVFNSFSTYYTKPTRDYVPTFLFNFMAMMVLLTMNSIMALSFEEATFLSTSGPNGVFSWTSPTFFWITFFVSFFVGFIRTNAVSFALKYIDALIYSTINLINPLTASLIAYFIGVDKFPHPYVIVGGGIITFGIGIVKLGEYKREKTQEARLLSEKTKEIK